MFEAVSLKKSTPNTADPLLVSKFLKISLLLDPLELAELFSSISHAFPQSAFYYGSGLVNLGSGRVSFEYYLQAYSAFIEPLKKGDMPPKPSRILSSFLSVSADCLYAMEVEQDKQVVKAIKPVIQFVPNFIYFSKDEKTFHPHIYGTDAIVWGLLCSYPCLYQEPKTHEVFQVKETSLFPNSALFKYLQKWVREKTLPTPMLIDGEKKNLPLRLGKKSFEWICNHRQLAERNLYVVS